MRFPLAAGAIAALGLTITSASTNASTLSRTTVRPQVRVEFGRQEQRTARPRATRGRHATTTPPTCTNSGMDSFVGVTNDTAGPNHAGGDFSAVLGGTANDACEIDSGIGAGYGNGIASSSTVAASFIAGGEYNAITSDDGFVGAGYDGVVSGDDAFVGGGYGNQATAQSSFIGGGGGYVDAPDANTASAQDAFVGAGEGNTASGLDSLVVGGNGNSATALDSVVVGGNGNETDGGYAFIGGGYGNGTQNSSSFIGAGTGNIEQGNDAATGAGSGNGAGGDYSFIGSGQNNAIAGQGSFVGAGGYIYVTTGKNTSKTNNSASGEDSFIGAGDENTVASNESFIGSGLANSIGSGDPYSLITGGYGNVVSSQYGTIDGGESNTAGGNFATIPGGAHNKAMGTLSFAAGYQAQANHNGSFVWSDYVSGASPLADTNVDQFVVRASGGVFVYSSEKLTSGVKLAAGSGTWASLSDRNAKTAIVPVDDEAILAKVAALPVSTWQYKTEKSVRHVGPMSQDFYSAFGVGEDDRHITSIDEDGVALAAIKAVNHKLTVQNSALRNRFAALEAQNARMAAVSNAQIGALRTELHELEATVSFKRYK